MQYCILRSATNFGSPEASSKGAPSHHTFSSPDKVLRATYGGLLGAGILLRPHSSSRDPRLRATHADYADDLSLVD